MTDEQLSARKAQRAELAERALAALLSWADPNSPHCDHSGWLLAEVGHISHELAALEAQHG